MGSLRLVAIAAGRGEPRVRAGPMAWDARQPQTKSASWISRSVRRERNSLWAAGPPRRAHCSIGRRGASAAMAQRAKGGPAPRLQSKKGPEVPIWERGRILPLTAPYATTVWDYLNRAMPVGAEGTLKPDEVYALTAYLLFLNKVIPEDQVLDKQSLPKVKMPIGDDYAKLPEWKPGTPRLQGYPY